MENLQELNAKIEDLLRLKKEANELIETTFRNDLKLSDTAKVRNIDTANQYTWRLHYIPKHSETIKFYLMILRAKPWDGMVETKPF